MAGIPRPGPGPVNKKHSSKPPIPRPSNKTQTSFSSFHTRSQSGTVSPTGQQGPMSTSHQPRSPQKSTNTLKRKERDFDTDAAEESNIHVVVRCRGRSDREVRENSGVVLSTDGVKGHNLELSMGPSALSNKTYRFDKVFSPAADQSMIYDEVVTPILDEMLAGYNCTIFAYGQTGTGKTYTMSGDMSDTLGLISDSAGIIPRVLNSLFSKLGADEGESSVKCSFIELYNEELRDLLSLDDSTKLKIYEDAQKKGHTATMVQGMEESYIKTAADGIKLLQNGSHKRQVAATKCNDLSSRSHTVFTVTAYIKKVTDAGEDFVSAGKLNLVDLAGSENIQRSGAENKRAAEAGLINKSLLTLGRVINALVERGSHIPYRESKLTRLLQDSLGGRTKTCIIATVSPAKSNLEETISTLDYAFRAKNIKNKPQVNAMISKKTLLKEFTAEIEKLKGELIATRHRNGVYLTAEGYDEIMVQSESRRILSDEQREKIETMEANLRNKVQELFTITNTFAVLKKDFDVTRQSLDDASGILKKTEFVLADTKLNLADETILRKAHQATEGALHATGSKLTTVLVETVDDIDGLHSKLQRNSDLQDTNRGAWQDSQRLVEGITTQVEQRIVDFQHDHGESVSRLTRRIQDFNSEEVRKIGSAQDLLKLQNKTFTDLEEKVEKQRLDAKEEMNNLLEEIKTLRDNVKLKLEDGLNELSTAAGRISAEVVKELVSFQSGLQGSYSSLGKDFKTMFDDMTKHMNAQRHEIAELRQKMSDSMAENANSQSVFSTKLESSLQEEESRAVEDRQALLAQISDLINQSHGRRAKSWSSKIDELQKDLAASQTTIQSTNEQYNSGMARWTESETLFTEQLTKTREGLKSKIKDDWKQINERTNSIQTSTKSIHEQTTKIVVNQIGDVSHQMQTLDDYVARARSQNETHSETHHQNMKGLKTHVLDSYAGVDAHLSSAKERESNAKQEFETLRDNIERGISPLTTNVVQPLIELRGNLSNAIFHEYVATGNTPQRRIYDYPKILPRTDTHEELLGGVTVGRQSPSKSPSKTVVFTDNPTSEFVVIAPSPTKEGGLREISLNIAPALTRKQSDPTGTISDGITKSDSDAASMGPPPFKRQATDSRLPTKFGGSKTSVVKLEGRENLGASFGSSTRRLRSSPSN